jgi:putative addiction module component (TIGR02574 family)
MMSFLELVEMVKELPLDLKLELIEKISENINYPVDPEIESAWDKEIENRIADLDNGRITSISYKAVQKKMAKILGK